MADLPPPDSSPPATPATCQHYIARNKAFCKLKAGANGFCTRHLIDLTMTTGEASTHTGTSAATATTAATTTTITTATAAAPPPPKPPGHPATAPDLVSETSRAPAPAPPLPTAGGASAFTPVPAASPIQAHNRLAAWTNPPPTEAAASSSSTRELATAQQLLERFSLTVCPDEQLFPRYRDTLRQLCQVRPERSTVYRWYLFNHCETIWQQLLQKNLVHPSRQGTTAAPTPPHITAATRPYAQHAESLFQELDAIPGINAAVFRQDWFGNVITRHNTGNIIFDRHIDHLIPTARGGAEAKDNYTIMHGQANRIKNDAIPHHTYLNAGFYAMHTRLRNPAQPQVTSLDRVSFYLYAASQIPQWYRIQPEYLPPVPR